MKGYPFGNKRPRYRPIVLKVIGLATILCHTIIPLNACVANHGVKSPSWWLENRAIYASFALSGAGGSFMKFPGEDITKKLKSFDDLPVLLDDARKLGCNCVYLVDYWEGGYENKGDYVPRSDLGGSEAFKRGIEALHAKGGRIILYLEAFIVNKKSLIGRLHGADWAMKDANGAYYTYYGRDRFYLMYPGDGSGWKEYLCSLAEEMARTYKVDGFHLDSYGLQWDWKDFNPKHPGATDGQGFNRGAVSLVKEMRERVWTVNPEAIVMLEGCEHTELLDVCDGGQLDSAAWQDSPMKTLLEKPWVNERKYKVFTSHFSIVEMDRILDAGYRLSLTPWWFQPLPDEDDFKRMRREINNPNEWYKRITTLWYWDNLLYVNGIPRPKGVDLFQLRRDLEMQKYRVPGPPYDTPDYRKAVEAYEPLIRKLVSAGKPIKTQADYIRERLSGTPAISSQQQIPP